MILEDVLLKFVEANDIRWLYAAKIIVVAGLLWGMRSAYSELRWPGAAGFHTGCAVIAGIVVFVAWINMTADWMVMGKRWALIHAMMTKSIGFRCCADSWCGFSGSGNGRTFGDIFDAVDSTSIFSVDPLSRSQGIGHRSDIVCGRAQFMVRRSVRRDRL